ncbi:Cleavage and polyadenylation specificity factor subunit 2 [Acropora cervicornis]|uniref:Cleavage and polyadenylation specificity factor subunit 2 n=1 Tax=Acropora cervicornis TaxID=6130 RepID=A0AAD9Q1P6_ACRCE|nr:Cleavage and polyadenylation specificity factor subunit 2 [Acropora cervicornis]
MTSIIKLTVLSGAYDEGPLCYLLQVDEFRFLLDCGWDETFSEDVIEPVKKLVHQIDAVLITFPDIYHMGALPYLVGKCGLHCPIYTTIPVYKMGQMFILDDVDAAFDKIIQLKYSQNVSLKGKGHGLMITPYAAGHMIGGTMWKVVKDGEEDIIYAVDYNHKKERHLNGAVLETLSRPSLLITDSFNALNVQARRRERDTQLMTEMLNTTRRDGNVLIAVDTAGRVLELSQLLVEWMSDKVMKSFEIGRMNPYQFRYCTLCHSLADLARVPDPKVVLASVADLTCGFSRELFIKWAEEPKNTVVFTCRPSPGTLARSLIDNLQQKTVDIEVKTRVKLEGDELERYLEEEKEKEKNRQVNEATERSHLTAEESDSDSDEDLEGGVRHDLMMADEKLKCQKFRQSVLWRKSSSTSGRSDGESIKRILSLVNPRNLILVHGVEEATDHLAEYCRQNTSIQVNQVFTPRSGETVDSTELAWVDGQLHMNSSESHVGLVLEDGELRDEEEGHEKMETNQSNENGKEEPMDSVPVLEQLQLSQITGHTSVYINEPRLSDFKQVLNKAGIQAEFAGGALICNNNVAVRRNETGRVGLEGAVCDDYYKIRELLYEQYAVV